MFSSVQSLSHVRLSATPWIAACQASQSITNSWSSLKLTSIELVMPSSHLILCRPLLLLPPNPSQHQGLFQWVNSSHEVAKVLEFQLQHHSLQRNPRADLLQNGLVGFPCSPCDPLMLSILWFSWSPVSWWFPNIYFIFYSEFQVKTSKSLLSHKELLLNTFKTGLGFSPSPFTTFFSQWSPRSCPSQSLGNYTWFFLSFIFHISLTFLFTQIFFENFLCVWRFRPDLGSCRPSCLSENTNVKEHRPVNYLELCPESQRECRGLWEGLVQFQVLLRLPSEQFLLAYLYLFIHASAVDCQPLLSECPQKPPSSVFILPAFQNFSGYVACSLENHSKALDGQPPVSLF